MNGYFFGKYFKCVSEDASIAFIPALHRRGGRTDASLQIITPDGALNVPFPEMKKEKDGSLSLGACSFSDRGITLSHTDGETVLGGEVKFSGRTPLGRNIMGPFRFLPFMQCRHSVYSMHHRVDGELFVCGKSYRFNGGHGYTEGDRGVSFPKKYVWSQCFAPDVSLMLAAATVPIGPAEICGTIASVMCGKREYRLATYSGARAEFPARDEIIIRQGGYTLRAKLLGGASHTLSAPQFGKMSRMIREGIAVSAEYSFCCEGRTICAFSSDRASFEYEM